MGHSLSIRVQSLIVNTLRVFPTILPTKEKGKHGKIITRFFTSCGRGYSKSGTGGLTFLGASFAKRSSLIEGSSWRPNNSDGLECSSINVWGRSLGLGYPRGLKGLPGCSTEVRGPLSMPISDGKGVLGKSVSRPPTPPFYWSIYDVVYPSCRREL